MKRDTVTPPSDMFWGRELTREEFARAERGYPFEDFLERANFSYMATLIP